MTRLAIICSHPIQYYSPLFRELARRLDLHVFYAHQATASQQASAGFGTPFTWDVDLTSGYEHSFLRNVSRDPRTDRFSGCDTPEIGRKLAEGRFDAVLVMGWHLKCMIQAVLAGRRLGLRVLVRGDSQVDTPRSSAKRFAKALAYPVLLRAFDAALYVGVRSRAYYEHYGYPADRLVFSPHCVDTEWFSAHATDAARKHLRKRLGIPATAKTVLFAGKLVAFKRPVDVIEACGRGPARGTHVLVAGSGDLEPAMRARASELGVPLHLLGFVNQSEMPAAYAAADLLVLPSTGRETWGLVTNEALACGTPVAVSNAVGCAPDLAEDRRAGGVFPVGDLDNMSIVIERLLSNPPRALDIRNKSQAYSLAAAAEGVVAAAARRLAA